LTKVEEGRLNVSGLMFLMKLILDERLNLGDDEDESLSEETELRLRVRLRSNASLLTANRKVEAVLTHR
jgi:hypothetical protein